jgi:MoaA/NifB/PqqE/SkfB family radical SAM enzyme
MRLQTVAAQILKKIISPEGIIYKKIRLIHQYACSFKRLKKLRSLVLTVKITDHCNLNCACCNQLSPLSDEVFYPVDAFKRDCLRLFRLGGEKISKITFSGGEPLLHPQITDFFDAARECFDNYRAWGGGGILAS